MLYFFVIGRINKEVSLFGLDRVVFLSIIELSSVALL